MFNQANTAVALLCNHQKNANSSLDNMLDKIDDRLKELKKTLEDQFDHTLIVAQDDPEMDTYKLLGEKKMAKIVVLPRLGCEGLSDMLYKYVNAVYIPDNWGSGEAARLWCYRVEVRETQANMAFREGHRCWNEDLFN
jgi:6-pyruvoyltetrahydropterin/6-carboxytetrahydropterin synthase